jgi:hypothetical protein
VDSFEHRIPPNRQNRPLFSLPQTKGDGFVYPVHIRLKLRALSFETNRTVPAQHPDNAMMPVGQAAPSPNRAKWQDLDARRVKK